MKLLNFLVALFIIANSRRSAHAKGEYIFENCIRRYMYNHILVGFVYLLIPSMMRLCNLLICQLDCEVDLNEKNLKTSNTKKKIYPLIVDASGNIIYPRGNSTEKPIQRKLAFGKIFLQFRI